VKLILIIFLLVFSQKGFNEERNYIAVKPKEHEKYRNIRVITHPEKGVVRFDNEKLSGDKSIQLTAYQKDIRECSHSIFKKGVLINGVEVTDYNTITNAIAQDALDSLQRLLDGAETGKENIEFQRVREELKECIAIVGWVEGIERVLNE